jgi:hypothetical protein
MNKVIKKQWVAALRSGKYKQAKKQLKKGQGFCCLGVLTDLYFKSGAARPTWGKPVNIKVEATDESLPYCVMEWAGLESSDPSPSGSMKTLSNMNDGDRGAFEPLSFKEIASVIEKGL